MPTDNHQHKHNPHPQRDDEHPGYETTDVNVGGVIVFLSGLMGFLLVFFAFCFILGKVINNALEKQDGPADKWHQGVQATTAGGSPTSGKREDLASSPEMQQRALAEMTATFQSPRLQTDDGNQDTADLHAREDLLLNHYSVSPEEGNQIRIPIDRAMALIVQRGLPVNAEAASTAPLMVGESRPVVTMPLTTGFARTSYELDAMERREQKMNYGKAVEGSQHAQLAPAR